MVVVVQAARAFPGAARSASPARRQRRGTKEEGRTPPRLSSIVSRPSLLCLNGLRIVKITLYQFLKFLIRKPRVFQNTLQQPLSSAVFPSYGDLKRCQGNGFHFRNFLAAFDPVFEMQMNRVLDVFDSLFVRLTLGITALKLGAESK